ncbi:MAG: DegT/DnrJ/EryC1/StrS family aminotransferase, partial [Terriglobia bacterium]
RFALALPSCTSAIHLALLALDIGPGDEVVVPDVTWIATAAPITYVGATPVFADVDPNTWCLSAPSLEACITAKTKAVIPVDLYGSLPDMDALSEVAHRNRVVMVEDAAEAIGSEYKGKKAGSFGEAGVFSFHGSKTLTTGEGGMLVSNRENVYQRALILRDHGRMPGDRMFFNSEVAYKYKMSSMQAALGLAQLERIEELVDRKRRIFAWYQAELAGLDGVTLNCEAPDTKNTFWMVTVLLDPQYRLTKDHVMTWMSEREIDCRPFFHPLSSLPAYDGSEEAKRARRRNQVSYRISACGVNLPSGFNLSEENVKYVCDSLKELLAQPNLRARSGNAAFEARPALEVLRKPLPTAY